MSNLYSHNKEIFDGILKSMSDGHKKIGYTEATGLGKSFVFMELCKTVFLAKRVLYVVPKLCISEAITFYKEYNFLSTYVDFTTYAMFNSEDKVLEYAEKYDVLFADECHHLISDIQGCNVDICGSLIADKADGFYFGMTASYTIDGVNIMGKFFDTTIYGNDIYDAIMSGIYPKMDYCVAIPDTYDIPKNLTVKYNIDCTKSMLKSILSDKDVHKVLAFYPNKKELLYNMRDMGEVFKGYKIFVVYHGDFSTKENLKTVSDFNDYEGDCILASISMLLEGVHAKDVDCALIYRNVSKLHTLEQLVGRLFFYGMKKSPLIIDVTGSVSLFNKSELNVSRGCGTKRVISNIREIFNPNCSQYCSIDFLEAVAESRKSRYIFDYSECFDGSYRGINYPVSASELSKVLGVSLHLIITRYNISDKFNLIVDYVLDEFKKRRNPLNYVLEEPYGWVEPFNGRNEFIKIFPKHWSEEFFQLIPDSKSITIYDLLDYCMDRLERKDLGENLFKCPAEGWRGLNWSSIKELSSIIYVKTQDLLKSYRVIEDMYADNTDVDKLSLALEYAVDNFSVWKLFFEYRGIGPCKTYIDIADCLGITAATLHRIKRKVIFSDNAKAIIDYVLDEYFLFSKEHRGIKPCATYSDIDRQLGVRRRGFTARYLYDHKDKTVLDAIDYAFDVYLKSK